MSLMKIMLLIVGTNSNKATTGRSFEYKSKIQENTSYASTLVTKVVVLKNLSNFWRYLDLSFINSEIELDLSW